MKNKYYRRSELRPLYICHPVYRVFRKSNHEEECVRSDKSTIEKCESSHEWERSKNKKGKELRVCYPLRPFRLPLRAVSLTRRNAE